MSLSHTISRFFLPQFSNLDLFAIGYAVALVGAWQLKKLFYPSTEDGGGFLVLTGGALWVLVGIVVLFAILVTWHVFSVRERSKTEEQFVLTIALAVTLFSVVVLYVRALTSGTFVIIVLQLLYIAWLIFLIRHVNDDGAHLHARMLLPQHETRVTVVAVAYVLFGCSVFFLYVCAYSWEVTLALLIVSSVPIVRGVTTICTMGVPIVRRELGVWSTVFLISVPILIAGCLSFV